MNNCKLFVSIGTSGHTIDLNLIAKHKKSILNNLEKNEMIDDSLFEKVYYEKTTNSIFKMIKDIEKEII